MPSTEETGRVLERFGCELCGLDMSVVGAEACATKGCPYHAGREGVRPLAEFGADMISEAVGGGVADVAVVEPREFEIGSDPRPCERCGCTEENPCVLGGAIVPTGEPSILESFEVQEVPEDLVAYRGVSVPAPAAPSWAIQVTCRWLSLRPRGPMTASPYGRQRRICSSCAFPDEHREERMLAAEALEARG